MNAPLDPGRLEDRGVLRFITAGSVDDGKSTLIGRLLVEAKGVLADQLAAVRRASERRGSGELDLSLLTDGLEAEREQGITIDVAYRYFSSPVRKFIVADAPGHEQYTRNMVTGASTADAAVVLVDATRVGVDGLLPQTRRHSAIAALLGIRHVVVAVNKMDLVGWERAVFERIAGLYDDLAHAVGLKDVRCVPVSALQGDNVTRLGSSSPWYAGPTLLALLEALPADRADAARPLRFPVQLVIRANGAAAEDYRGYAGQLWSGVLRAGQEVRILPSGERARVASIDTLDGALAQAVAGQSVTVRLDRDVDLSRGDWIVDDADEAKLGTALTAELCWLDRSPLDPRRKYLLRQGTRTSLASVLAVEDRLDVSTLSERREAAALNLNDIGRVRIAVQQPVLLDAYARNPATGAFILVDAATNRRSWHDEGDMIATGRPRAISPERAARSRA
jgi:sulfate adenylyltransferase subunit 1